jgi:hypothetical protein
MVIPPEILARGFWLYVWVITLKGGSNEPRRYCAG